MAELLNLYDDSDDEDSEYGSAVYPLHDAAEEGNAERLRALLVNVESDSEFQVGVRADENRPDKRDRDGLTPLHVAILSGRLECIQVLLEAGSDVSKPCEGSLPLHMAVSVGALPQKESLAEAALLLLIKHGAVVYDRDDQGRTALHWAAAHGLHQAAMLMLDAAAAMQAQHQAQPDQPELPRLQCMQDKQGNTALHLAVLGQHSLIAAALLSSSDPQKQPEEAEALSSIANRSGMLALHAAAAGGCAACIQTCMNVVNSAADTTGFQSIKDKRGFTPLDWARRLGNQAATWVLEKSNGGVTSQVAQGDAQEPVKPTLVVAPMECHNHRTCPEPITRHGAEPPSENVKRLTVLTHPASGILRSHEFSDLQWDTSSRRGCMADILRVHDWSYVRSLQHLCASLPDDSAIVGHLDGDTAISHGTFDAALVAVGGICNAVDQVVKGQARNAFCAIRPPGHHAGPTGVVTCANDPTGSHGFCLLSNLAIGAAYAMNAHRHAGIKRVALLDFDVHHGNGTEACVAATAPSLRSFSFKTPFSEGSQTFPVFSPWLDTDDANNILFASVQGYGEKAPGTGFYVYPGSGATCDTKPVQAAAEAPAAAADSSLMEGIEDEELVEDPDNEFGTSEAPGTAGPRIINVGIPGPGAHVPLWKRAWRDKIIPAVVGFKPDIIFISAGFDAHKKDDINFRYIGIQEKDFEWLTEQLVTVANKVCNGRIVSALEGGYRIQGGIVSAFARSVAAHVRALKALNRATWSWAETKAEQLRERQRKAQQAELERQRHVAAQAARLAQQQAAEQSAVTALAAADAQALPGGNSVLPPDDTAALIDTSGVSQAAAAALVPVESSPVSGRKRRRTAVDYVALNKQLESEAGGGTAALNFATTVPSSAVGVHAGSAIPNERPDSLMDDTALMAEHVVNNPQQPHEGDRLA